VVSGESVKQDEEGEYDGYYPIHAYGRPNPVGLGSPALREAVLEIKKSKEKFLELFPKSGEHDNVYRDLFC
jgi:hypothetical protein